jgi:glutamate-5-semialdehyde dehydrogenase
MSVQDLLLKAKSSQTRMATANTNTKNAALLAISELLIARTEEIIAGNSLDLAAGIEAGLSSGLQDRLRLDSHRIQKLASAVQDVIGLPDPIGENVSGMTLPNALKLQQVRVPFGVVGVIYEARPNVTIDLAALAVKSGNALVLRGGSAAENTNKILVEILQEGLAKAGLPSDAIQSVDQFGRDGAVAMMQARGLIDVLIPRGSAGLIKTVVTESKVPVIETGDGVVHMFLDDSANTEMAIELVVNSKVQRPSVCNALETLLVHSSRSVDLLPLVAKALQENGVTIHGCEQTLALVPGSVAATEEDWHAEYYSLDLAVKVVASLEEALAHIEQYSTHHTESIVTQNLSNSERFLQEVDSAVVMVNASTRFTDGGEFGFGSEVGISTQKLHARGPMGLRELTSTKWLVRGSGQVRS